MKRAKWECEECHTPVTHLTYCPRCLKIICNNCRDAFIGTCKDCVTKLIGYGMIRGIKQGAEKTKDYVTRSHALRKLGISFGKCRECGRTLIITPDKTTCCSSCGLVIGIGYSRYGGAGGSGSPGWSGVTDNIQRIFEDRISKEGWG